MLEIFAHADRVKEIYASSGDISINWVAILLAVVAAMIIGFVWYGPLFGKQWMKLVGLKKKDIEKDQQMPLLIMLGLAIVQAFVLAYFIAFVSDFYPEYSQFSVGVLTGAWAFVGFVLPVLISNTVFSKGSKDLLKINLGNQFVTLVVIGAIIGSVS